jgi:acyl-CoA reductase-like NAD-dependent aldehyde dehydrogenase
MENLKVYNPYTRTVIREIPFDNKKGIEEAIERAYQLHHNYSNRIPKYKRIQILETFLCLMNQKFDELVETAVQEGGKPFRDSVVEVNRAINGVKLTIAHLNEMKGKMIPMGTTEGSQNRLAYTELEPTGVVLAISAFNHPVNLIVHQVITALAVGAPVIVKPALKTPLSCKLMVDLLYEAGLPVDWCQMVICKNSLTEKMAGDKRISFISFIGSHKVGWHLRSVIAPGTRIVLEHGGVAPVIIDKDADIKNLIQPLIKGAFYHAGQVCVSVQRIYVHESVIDQFLEKFLKAMRKLKTGNPAKEQTDVGPLILPEEATRVEKWVLDAEFEGGKILAGGQSISNVSYQPTLILNPATYSSVSSEEVFGPVVSVFPFSERQEAIKLANNLPFSFQAAVFTKNLDNALHYTRSLKANTVIVNDHTAFRVDWMPFGASELAGLGTGGIKYIMKDMCKEKLIVLNSKEL